VVLVAHVGDPIASDITNVLWCEHRFNKALYPSGNVLPNEELVDAAVREMFEETGMTPIVVDLSMLSGKVVRVLLPDSKTQHFYVYYASIHVPYGNNSLRTSAKVVRVVHSQSIVQRDDSDIVQASNALDGLTTTPFVDGVF
jgi:8-oxo-dGTP pyrophosphatase MutT (NUDIX family)